MAIDSNTTETAGGQRAWLLNVGQNQHVVLAWHEMSQISLKPTFFKIPQTPTYCCHVMQFQDQIIPIMDLSILLQNQFVDIDNVVISNNIIGIAVYQTEPHTPLKYVAFPLVENPETIIVYDHQACDFPDKHQSWQDFSFTCLEVETEFMPIINLTALLSTDIRDIYLIN
jgi:chemotaxis signal transduction protein